MTRSLLHLLSVILLTAGCGQPSPPAPAAPPSPVAEVPPPVMEKESPPVVAPADAPAVAHVPAPPSDKPAAPVDAKAALVELKKLLAARDQFDFDALDTIHARVVELGEPGFQAAKQLASSGTLDQRFDCTGFLARFEDRREEVLPVLIANLDFETGAAFTNETFRGLIMGILSRFGEDASSATPKLVQILQADDGNSNAACEALAKIGEPRATIVPAFVAALVSKDSLIRCSACEGLGEMHKDAEPDAAAPIVAALRPMLKDKEDTVRTYAAGALGEIGPAAKLATPDLALATADPDEDVRYTAADSLGKIGFAHPKIEAALLTLVGRDEDAAWHAADSLLKLGISESADPTPLVQALKHKEDLARRYAANLLEHLKPAEDKLPATVVGLIGALGDKYGHVRNNSLDALVAYAEFSRYVPDEMLKLLRSEDIDQRTAAANFFVNIGAAAKPYVPELKKIAADEKEEEVKELLEQAVKEAQEESPKEE